MEPSLLLDQAVKAVVLTLILSLPPILVATVVGVMVSLVQALTQIQEQTLPFVIKLVAVTVTLLATAAWMGAELMRYTIGLFDLLPGAVP